MYVRLIPGLAALGVYLAAAGPNVAAEPAADAFAVASDHYARGRWKQAEDELSRFVQQYPQSGDAATAMFLLGESRLQQAKYPEAAESFRQFLAAAPQHRFARQAVFREGESRYLAGQLAEARPLLEQFRQRYPEDALNAYVLGYLGDAAIASREGPRAQGYYAEALRRFPTGPLKEECRFGLGRSLELQGQADAARREYRSLIQDQGRLADDALVQLGISYYGGRRYDEAIAGFREALERYPDSDLAPHARYWLGISQIAVGQAEQAAATLGDGAAQFPQHDLAPSMTYWMADAQRRRGNIQAARQGYRTLAERWPASDWVDEALAAELQLALDAQDHAALDAGWQQWQKRCGASPLAYRAAQFVGRSLIQRERYDEAVEILTSAAQAGDGSPRAASAAASASAGAGDDDRFRRSTWYYLALALVGQESHEAALAALDKVAPRDNETDLLAAVQLARAAALLGQQKPAEAVDPLRRYLELQPDGPEASRCRVRLVSALARSGKLAEALRQHGQLAEVDRQDSLFWTATQDLAEQAYQAAQYDSAETLFAMLTQAPPAAALAAKGWSGLGWTNYQREKDAAAIVAFDRVLQDYADSPPAAESALMRAKALQRLGRRDEAVTAYLLLAARYPESDQVAPALLDAARLQEDLDRKADALATLEHLTRQYPDGAQADAALYQQAWLLADLQRTEQSDEVFRQLSARHPESRYWADAVYRLAERAARQSDYDRADELIQQLIRSDRCRGELRSHALYLQGQVAGSAGRWDQAAASVRQLLGEFPDTPLKLPAEFWLAESYFRRGQTEQAAEAFARIEKQLSGRQDPWLAVVPLRRAQLLVQQEQWQEAREIAAGIQQRFPGFRQQYEVDYLLGRCLAAAARFQEARQAYERVILSPEGGRTETAAMAQWMIGESYLHQKNYDEAIRAYHRVDSLFAYPRWQAAALLQAGKCYQLRGEPDQAASMFDRVLKDHSQTDYAQEASTRLKELRTEPAETRRLRPAERKI